MKLHSKITMVTASLALGALGLPAAAGAADINTAVQAVKAHTSHADAALDRAVSLFERNHDHAARRAYAKSRKQMGLAKAAAVKARHQADSPSEYKRAARAEALLADQLDENIEPLVGVLPEAPKRDESKIASAARSDTKGREKAMAVLTALLAKVPEQARTGIANAIASLSLGRDDEVRTDAKALVSSHVTKTNKQRVVSALRTSVDGPVTASATLAALIASPNMPAESKPGLQSAYDALTAEHGSIADILSHLSDRMPPFARTFVASIITQVKTDAQGMRENHPTGPPAGIPGGPPSGAPGPPTS